MLVLKRKCGLRNHTFDSSLSFVIYFVLKSEINFNKYAVLTEGAIRYTFN